MQMGDVMIASELQLRHDGGLQVIVLEIVTELRLKRWEQ